MKAQLFTEFFFIRIIIDVLAVVALVRFVYLPIYHKKDFYFAFFILNFLVFVITFLLNKTSAFSGVGTAFGLLAFFTLLRLRTETISMKDTTYLFIVLTLGLINATMTGPYYELITLNVIIVGLSFTLDKEWLSKSLQTREMELDSLEYIIPEKIQLLIESLRTRTGLDIQRIKIESVDLVKGRATIKIYHY